MKARVTVGLAGSGFAAGLHAQAYRRVYGVDVSLKAVASPAADAGQFAARHGIPAVYEGFEQLLEDKEIDVVDLCTPPSMHLDMVRAAALAGKHVICEKPLTGWFAGMEAPDPRTACQRVGEAVEETGELLQKTGVQFFYAENFLYAPAVRKSAELLEATCSKVLFMKGEESHSGSHAPHAALWRYNGGGALIRQGCHPLSACLHLKMVECAARGEEFSLGSVYGDMGRVTAELGEEERRFIASRPVDVEDCASLLLTFGDGTKANIVAGDMALGGVRNLVEVFTSGGVHRCDIAPNSHMRVYHPSEEGLETVYLTEKAETRAGWQSVCLDEEATRGYAGEIQDFMECAVTGRPPVSGYGLAALTTRVIYAAYLSDRLGRRVPLS